MKAIQVLKRVMDYYIYENQKEEEVLINEAIAELEVLENDLKDLFSCIELTEDESAEKRLVSMETYLIRLSRVLK